MGAEALAIVTMVGRDRLPRQWERWVEKDYDDLRAFVDDETHPQWLRDSVETSLALRLLVEEMNEEKRANAQR